MNKYYLIQCIYSLQKYGWALSKQQTLLNLLNIFAVAEATAYTMMQYSYAVLQIYSNGKIKFINASN